MQQALNLQEDSELQEIDALIDSFDVAMLITESLDGDLRGRPMAIAGHEDGTVVHFLARGDDEKLQEILRQPKVNVVMQDDGRYLSISGHARIETDINLIKDNWSESARLWFPDGPDDPTATLVIVEPSYAECWDRTGLNRLEFWWEAGKALLRGEKAANKELDGHTKVRL